MLNIIMFDIKRHRFYLSMILLFCISLILPSSMSNANDNVFYEYPSAPKDVVAKYCNNDFNGDGLSSKTWPNIKNYTTWMDAPGWDITVVIKSYNVMSVEQYARTAKVKVKYQVVGFLESGEKYPRIKKDIKNDIVEYVLIHDNNLWKIEGPQDPPRISTYVAIELLEKKMLHVKELIDKGRIKEDINWLRKKY